MTVSGYCVYPMVGWIESPVNFVPQEREVADVFEVPLSFVLDPRNRTRESILYEGSTTGTTLPYPGRRAGGNRRDPGESGARVGLLKSQKRPVVGRGLSRLPTARG